MELAGTEMLDKAVEVERRGLGTPATRAGVIENLIYKGFIERDKKNLLATHKGINLITIVSEKFKSAETTAKWEMELSDIASGNERKSCSLFLLEVVNIETLNVLELFGGIGAIRKVLIRQKISHKVINYVEIDKNCVKSYNALYNADFKPKSIIGYNPPKQRIDLLMHGSPCQDFSRAGLKQGGERGSGTRSSLLFETIRIIEEMAMRPKIVIWENVKGVLDKNLRASFFHYLTEMERLGYENKYAILNAMDFGIPQKRERIFVVSMLGKNDFDFSKLKPVPTRDISEFLEKNVSELYEVRQESMLCYLRGQPKNKNFKGKLNVIDKYAYTITTKQVRIPNSGIVDLKNGKYRYLTEKECFRLMGFDEEDFEKLRTVFPERKGMTSSILYKQAGNSIVVNVLENIVNGVISL